MPKITRFFQKIFAGDITPTGNVSVFGSLAAGSPSYSNDPSTIQSLDAWVNGWADATVGNQSPAFQDFNAYQFVVTRQLAYLMQAGIPEWNTDTVYYVGSFCQSAGIIYRSLTNDNTGNAVTDTGNWQVLLSTVATSGSYPDLTNKPSSQLATAWVNFNGTGTVSIRSSHNVSSITDVSNGKYRVNFTTVMNNANYAAIVSSSLSTQTGTANQGTALIANDYLTDSFGIYSGSDSGSPFDPFYVSAAVYGGL